MPSLSSIEAAFHRWQEANKAYLNSRLKYDTASLAAQTNLNSLRADFLRKKEAVKKATDAYYAVINSDKPLTLSIREESLIFSEEEITAYKALAKKAQQELAAKEKK